MTKIIKISKENHDLLSDLSSKNDTFDDVITFLIDYYRENEELLDKQAKLYNGDIENFEKGNLDDVSEISLSDLEKRISKLENELK